MTHWDFSYIWCLTFIYVIKVELQLFIVKIFVLKCWDFIHWVVLVMILTLLTLKLPSKWIKSRLIQKFDYILATVRYNGTRYSVRGFIDSGFVSQDGLFKHYDVFNIELISCPWNELPTKENSKKIVLDISNHHRDFPLVEYILKLKYNQIFEWV